MSHATAVSLPSLVHQVIVHPGHWLDNNAALLPEYLPPFPEINLSSWDGFALSNLHWVGVRASNTDFSREDQGRRLELATHHELYHRALALTPFSILKKYGTFILYDLIVTTFEEEQETIHVPLIPDESGIDLQKQWEIIVRLKNTSSLVEEVFTVRSSLLDARKLNLISELHREKIVAYYKKAYEKEMPGFSVAYDTFDFVAKKIGECAATSIIYTVLGTLNPTEAFLDIMSAICKIPLPDPVKDFLWKLSPEETEAITNYSFEEANRFFSSLINVLDPDDSRYETKRMSEIADAIKQNWSDEDKHSDFIKTLQSLSPTTLLISEYDYFTHNFFAGNGSQEVEYGNSAIFIEAIRQQLTQGCGVLCPFSLGTNPSQRCCGGRNRALLENIWSRTFPDSSCKLWRRMGCLNQPKQWQIMIPYSQEKWENLTCYNDGVEGRPSRPDVEEAKLQTSSKVEGSIEEFALSDIPDEVKVTVFEEAASLLHDIFRAPQNNTPIVEVLAQKQETLRQKGGVVFVGQPQPPETGQAPDLSEIPRWQGRKQDGMPLAFIQAHYGQWLSAFGAQEDTIFQDQIRKHNPGLIKGMHNQLREEGQGRKVREIVKPRSARLDRELENLNDEDLKKFPRLASTLYRRQRRTAEAKVTPPSHPGTRKR
jgi:hypothetical protein